MKHRGIHTVLLRIRDLINNSFCSFQFTFIVDVCTYMYLKRSNYSLNFFLYLALFGIKRTKGFYFLFVMFYGLDYSF